MRFYNIFHIGSIDILIISNIRWIVTQVVTRAVLRTADESLVGSNPARSNTKTHSMML